MVPVIQRLQNILVNASAKNKFLMDVYLTPNGQKKDLVVFCHGFKGFKDWGAWHLIAEQFALAGFVFVKFNFSHNGTTIDAPEDLLDMDAFSENNFSKEWSDLQSCIKHLKATDAINQNELNHERIHLIGHSRGGGLVLTVGHNLPSVQTITGWASVDSLDYAWKDPAFVEDWKAAGKYEVYNGRIKQNMPLKFQFYEDFQENKDIFTLRSNFTKFEGPVLLCHGKEDLAIPHTAAETIKSYRPENTDLILIEECDHVFNLRHPYKHNSLTEAATLLVNETINFIKKSKQ